MLKKFSLALVAVALISVSAKANDALDAGQIDLSSISDADNLVVDTNLDIDVDDLASKTGDADQAVEACFRRFGGWGGGWGCGYRGYYGSCYYPAYNYCYYPTYFTYRTVCYTPVIHTYACYPLYNWGCY